MTKKRKKLPPRPPLPPRMQRQNQIARSEAIKPKQQNRTACRKNKGRKTREEF